jgi:23S rRNA (pseudouridine1915-N3)-methyltransferase
MMRIAVISASARQPDWVRSGFEVYARRFGGKLALDLTEIPLPKRTRSAVLAKLVDKEGERMLAAVPAGAHVVALDERGRGWTTLELAGRLERWIERGRPVAMLIGGPDGLAPACRERADETWALSPLTLPHGLVRIIVAEAVYRGFSLLQGHPYHRA